MQEITIKEYAAIAGITPEAISYRMKKSKRLPGIKSYRFDVKRKCYILKYDGTKVDGVFRTYNNALRKS